MTKKTFFFPHDGNARNDEKILTVRMRFGMEGYGIYFALIEKLLESSAYVLLKDYDAIAFELRVGADRVKAVVEDFGLFQFTDCGKLFYSESLNLRMNPLEEIREKRSEAGRKGAEKRWNRRQKKAYAMDDDAKCVVFAIEKDDRVEDSGVEDSINAISPLPPKGVDDKLVWKKDYEIYLKELREGYRKVFSDMEWVSQQERFNPGVDIEKSVQKSCVNYWATEAGWVKKKRSRTTDIDWRSTFANAISQRQNRVYKNGFFSNQTNDKYEQKRINSEQRKLDAMAAIERCDAEAKQRRMELEAKGVV